MSKTSAVFMDPSRESCRRLDAPGILGWMQFGDLHLTTEHGQNYQDLLALIAEANIHLTGAQGVNFAVLPGDNADAGTEEQYVLVRRAIDHLRLPVHVLLGDHDIQSGNLGMFHRWLEPVLPKSFVAGGYRCVFLNSVGTGDAKGFGLGKHQVAWLEGELEAARKAGQRAALFMHTYPSELGDDARSATQLIRRHGGEVRVVAMGHTHYNEVANDGRVIYAATRSTGQIEEGPVGFSLTCLDGDTVSWKFKALSAPWPFVMITAPADRDLLTAELGPVRGTVEVRARAWDGSGIARAFCRVDDGGFQPMFRTDDAAVWRWEWDSTQVADSEHRLTVRAENTAGEAGEGTVTVLCQQAGVYEPPARSPVDLANSIGAHPDKGLLGTQLGPNKNGHPW